MSERTVMHWRKRVTSGRIVRKFGVRCNQLLSTLKLSYLDKTANDIYLPRDRMLRYYQLIENVMQSFQALHHQQVLLLKLRTADEFNKELKVIYTKYFDDQLICSESAVQLRNKLIEEFNSNLIELRFDCANDVWRANKEENQNPEVSKVEEEVEKILLEQRGKLYKEMNTAIDHFPESTTYKLLEIKQMEKRVSKKPKAGGGGLGLSMSMSLVGMVRPPGFGNVQGYLTYAVAKGLFGLIPFDILLGFQNDGDSPEV